MCVCVLPCVWEWGVVVVVCVHVDMCNSIFKPHDMCSRDFLS